VVFAARVKFLMTDVPDLPNFSRFHDSFRANAKRPLKATGALPPRMKLMVASNPVAARDVGGRPDE
jgi:hypothetical protein